jgi:orotidine-5'-phosphate decarboxylase
MSDLDPARDRLIVALDFPSGGEALDFDRRLEDEILWVKVGLELYTAAGPEVVRELKARGRRVFLDLKLHDIPNTVAGGVRAATGHGVDLLTLHAEGGPEMMQAAASSRDEAKSGLRLLAVTVLTSLTGGEYPDVYRSDDVGARVMSFAKDITRAPTSSEA